MVMPWYITFPSLSPNSPTLIKVRSLYTTVIARHPFHFEPEVSSPRISILLLTNARELKNTGNMRETWAGYVALLRAGIQDHGLIIGTTGIIIILLSFLLRYPSARFHNTIINHRHGFFPPPKIKSSDPFLGLDIAKKLRQAVAERRFLAFLLDLFRESGIWTLEVNLLGQTNVWTADPEIIRTILATRSRDWHIGTSRKELVDPVAGRNILTREGEDWRHTRAMMRPAFVKRQFGDMGELEKHVDRLMEHLPADGETVVDLKSLFYMLSMDVSTEFL